MKLSAKSRYGILGLIEIYKSKLSVAKIAEKHNISNKFLESCFSDLKKAGFLTSRTGANGGYYPTRSADEITIFDIISCLEGDCLVVERDPGESKIKEYIYNSYWKDINNSVEVFLKSKRLSEYL